MKLLVEKALSAVDKSFQEPVTPFQLPTSGILHLTHTEDTESSEILDEEIFALIKEELRVNGFDRGSVVVSRGIPFEKRIDPIHWGFVIGYNGRHPVGKKMKPIVVKWAESNYTSCQEDELIVIHRAHNKVRLNHILKGHLKPQGD